MRKINFMTLIALGVMLLVIPLKANASGMSDDTPIKFNQLPSKAQTFIHTYFSNQNIATITMDKELLETTYTVKFTDGAEVDFYKSGEWEEVDCVAHKVPEAIINPKIVAKVKELYPNTHITEIKKNDLNTEVRLSNGMELKFDKVINLIEVED